MRSVESKSMAEEAKRIHWRREILEGKHGAKAYKRLMALVHHGYSERFCT